MLKVEGLHAHYELSHVLQGVSLEVNEGETVCLLGRNGVGKTTTLKCIMGILAPSEGRVQYRGQDIAGLPLHKISRLGIAYVPETRRIFGRLSVRENLEMGLNNTAGLNATQRQRRLDEVLGYFPELVPLLKNPGLKLSGGQQQMLAIGRALMSHADLLLIDEPSEGLAPILVQHLMQIIEDINRDGRTVLLVEQNARMAIRISNRGYVLERGSVCFAGSKSEMETSPEVRERCGL
ncbi:MAG: ABC transporter ATP-binding protein [Candidatus Lambdaproteobacteria bacterium]|nr:ABC transporter ATP-binding protein [Candidatus Lambdaproteobacteria bacterium]